MTTLHVYGQSMPHDDVWIAGTMKELNRLRDAINNATNGWEEPDFFFANDGEGFRIRVRVLTKDDEPKLAVPYSDPYFRDAAGAHPSEL